MPSILLEADFLSLPGATGAGTWDDLTSRAKEITVKRGRNSELQRFETGTLDALLRNEDGYIPLANEGGILFAQNLIPNPSFEVDLGSLGVNQGTNARVSTDPRYGDWCVKHTVGGGGFGSNIYYTYQQVNLTGATAGRGFWGSIYLKGDGQSVDKTARIFMYENGGAFSPELFAGSVSINLRETYQRVAVGGNIVRNDRTNIHLYLWYSDDAARQAGDYFFSDGWMVSESGALLPYHELSGFGGKRVKPGRKVRLSAFHSESRNKIKNGDFDADVLGFNPYQNGQTATLAWDGTIAGAENGRLGIAKLTATSAPPGGFDIGVVSGADLSYSVKCNPGEQWTATGYARSSTAARPFITLIAFFDAAGSHLTTFSSQVSTDSLAWVRGKDFTFVCPTNARHFNVYIAFQNVASGEFHYVDKVSAWRGDSIASAPYEQWVPTGRNRLYVGYSEGWPPRKSNGVRFDTVALTAVDVLSVLAGKRHSLVRAQERTDQRLTAVLDDVGFSSADRAIDVGQTSMVAFNYDLASALQTAYDAEGAEQGQLYASGDGKATFENRYKRSVSYVTSSGVFADDGSAGSLPYEDIEVDFDWSLVYNDVKVEKEGGTHQVRGDVDSQAMFFERTLAKTLWLVSDAEADSVAQYLLARYREVQVRVNKIVLDPTVSSEVETQVLDRDISDRITVKFRVGPTVVTGDYHIEAVEHRIREGKSWRTTWQLSPAAIWQFWILDSPVNSVLGSTTRVGY